MRPSVNVDQQSIGQLIVLIVAKVRSAWRFRWLGAATAWAAGLAGLGFVTWLPNVYEASARIYVDTSSVLKPILTNQIVAPDVMSQLTYVNSALVGREHLLRVVAENHLDADAKTEEEREQVLERLYLAINNTTESVSRQPGNFITRTSYRHSDRDTAIGVVQTLVNSLVRGTMGATTEGSATAARFLEERIEDYDQRLQDAEQALADFKRANSNRLPGAEGGYYERIRQQQEELADVEEELRLTRSREEQLRRQLASESPVMPAGAQATGEPAPNSIDARIRDRQAQLDQLLLDFTEKHPDVINAREALSQLEAQRAQQLQALGINDVNQELSSLGSSPVYQALRIAINEASVEIATLEEDVRSRKEKLGALQQLVDEVPQVEAELARLNRDYEIVNAQYQRLIQSRETQDLSEKASTTDEIDFRELDPPFASFNPVAPNRPLLLLMVLVVSVGAGGALCWVLAEMRPVFVSAASLRAATGLPVLGSVSRAVDGRFNNRLSLLAFTAAIGGLGAIFSVAVLIELVGPGLRQLAGL
jgi:polysaccharide chain length determinant protein (PEP-CTERM system associated)